MDTGRSKSASVGPPGISSSLPPLPPLRMPVTLEAAESPLSGFAIVCGSAAFLIFRPCKDDIN